MPTDFVMPRIDVPIGRTSAGALVYFDGNFLRSFLQQLSDRIGGEQALSNTELEELASGTRLGVFGPRIAPQDPADVGYINTFSARPAAAPEPISIPQLAAFMPRPQEQSTPFADAGAVLCSRVFSAR